MTKTFSLYTQKCPFWASDLSIWKKFHLECLQSMLLHHMSLPREAKRHHCWLDFSNSNSAYHASVIFHPFCTWFGSISHMRSYKWIPCKFPAFFSFRIQSTANLWPNIAQMQIAWPVTVTFTHTPTQRQCGLFLLVCVSNYWMVSKTRFIHRSNSSNDPSHFRMKRMVFRTFAHLSQMLRHDFFIIISMHHVALRFEILSMCFVMFWLDLWKN